MTISGFDVSGNTGDVSFPAARTAGMRFVYARVGRGVPASGTDSYGLDVRWQQYRDAARDAGLLVGGYWRFYPDRDMALQVARFADRLDQMPGMLPPLLDIEDTGGLGPGPLTDWTIRCADMIRERTGRTPLIYSNAWNFGLTGGAGILQEWRLDRWERCVAHGSATSWPSHSAVFWQYDLDTHVPWASGVVDLQRFACRPADLAAHTYEHDLRYWIDEDGQLYGPRAVWRPLPEGTDERQRQTPRRVVLHTMVGWLEGTDSYFRSAEVGVESTFGTGHALDGPTHDGEIRQWVETDVIANANLEGDRGVPDCVSWESSDGAQDVPLSPRQAETTWQSMAAVCWRYGIPPVELPDSCEGRSGLGWHRLGVPGWPTTGLYRGKLPACEAWSTANGKTCPRDNKIRQMHEVGIPRIATILAGAKRTAPEPTPVDPWETTVEPVTIPLANTDPQQYAYVCPDGLVVGPLNAGAAGIVAFQNLYNGTANAVQLRIVQQERRKASLRVDLPPLPATLTTPDVAGLVDAMAASFAPALAAAVEALVEAIAAGPTPPPTPDPPPELGGLSGGLTGGLT
jgi:GH25 family lysozyme M1 (1,4-beta-N-acetylmuramidase)